MPQLDLIIVFPQIFWFFILFISFYTILLHYIFPHFLIILKSRKFIVTINTKEALKQTEKSINNDKLIINWIKKSLVLINTNFKYDLSKKKNHTTKIDLKLTTIIYELILYYNKYTLNLINLYHKNFNYKK